VHPIEWLRAVARSGDVPQAELAAEAAAALAAFDEDTHGLLPACRRLLDRNPTAGALWWTCARVLTSADPGREADAVRRDLESDQVGLSLALDLPDGATVAVIGWSDMAGEVAARRGDVRLLIVADRPRRSGPSGRRRPWDYGFSSSFDAGAGDPELDSEADDVVIVPPLGLGAAVAAADLLLVDAWAVGASKFISAPGVAAAAATAAQSDTALWLTVSVGRRLPQTLFEALLGRVFVEGVDPWDAPAEVVDLALVGTKVEPIEIACPVPPELLRRTT
jgi:hypothetical protein